MSDAKKSNIPVFPDNAVWKKERTAKPTNILDYPKKAELPEKKKITARGLVVIAAVLIVVVIGCVSILTKQLAQPVNPEVSENEPIQQVSVVVPKETVPVETEPIQTEPVQENNVVIPSEPETTEQVSEHSVQTEPEVKPTAEVIPAGLPLVVKDELWESAFIPHNSDGERLSGIGFNIQDKEEITLYSPIDGYIKYLNTESDGSGRGEIIVTKDGLWKPASTIEEANDPNRNKSFRFAGYGVKPIPANDTLVNKGDPIGVMKVSDRLVYENYVKEETSLIFYPEASWDKDITRSEDPREYLKQLLEIMEK